MQDITQPLKEIMDKGFPAPNSNRLVNPGIYKFVERDGNTLNSSENKGSSSRMLSKEIGVGFYFDGPFLPIRNGACYSLFNLMRALSRTIDIKPVLLNCFREWDAPEDYYKQDFSSIFMAPEDYYHDTGLATDVFEAKHLKIAQFYNTEILLRMGPWLKSIGARITLDVQNIDYILMQRLGAGDDQVQKAKDLQIAAIALTDHTFCRSNIDKDYVVALGADPDKVSVYKGGIRAADFHFIERSLKSKKLVYLGHMYYQPNENALDYIVESVLPKLDDEYTLTVIGSCPPFISKKYRNSRINFTGGINDIDAALQEYDIAIAPIFEGSGTRLKLLDYLASGIPVITTSLGAEGLDLRINQFLTIEDNLNEYAERVKDMAQSPIAYQRKARAGRKFIEEVYDWSHCIQPFVDVYEELAR